MPLLAKKRPPIEIVQKLKRETRTLLWRRTQRRVDSCPLTLGVEREEGEHRIEWWIYGLLGRLNLYWNRRCRNVSPLLVFQMNSPLLLWDCRLVKTRKKELCIKTFNYQELLNLFDWRQIQVRPAGRSCGPGQCQKWKIQYKFASKQKFASTLHVNDLDASVCGDPSLKTSKGWRGGGKKSHHTKGNVAGQKVLCRISPRLNGFQLSRQRIWMAADRQGIL